MSGRKACIGVYIQVTCISLGTVVEVKERQEVLIIVPPTQRQTAARENQIFYDMKKYNVSLSPYLPLNYILPLLLQLL